VFFLAPWCLCEKEIIPRKAAEAQRDGIFLCDLASLREKNHFTQSRKGGYSICGKSDRMVIAAFSIPQAVMPGIVGRMFIRPYTWNSGMYGGNGPGRLSESGLWEMVGW
jgi:hypothetical protein